VTKHHVMRANGGSGSGSKALYPNILVISQIINET